MSFTDSYNARIDAHVQGKQQQTEQAPQSFKDAMLARLAEQRAAGLEGHVSTQRTHSVEYHPGEHVQHNANPLLASVETLSGVPCDLPDDKDANLDGYTVEVNGMRIRASRAVELGVLKWRDPSATPAVTAGPAPVQQQVIQQTPAGEPAAPTYSEATIDAERVGEITEAYELLANAGQQPSGVMLEIIKGADENHPGIQALAKATNQQPAGVVEWAEQIRTETLGNVAAAIDSTSFKGMDVVQAALAANPARFEQAAMVALSSNSIVPLVRVVMQYADERPQEFAKFER